MQQQRAAASSQRRAAGAGAAAGANACVRASSLVARRRRGAAHNHHAVVMASSSSTSSSTDQQQQPSTTGRTTFHHGVVYTSYEGNCFHVKFNNSGARVLVDPWLVGDLTFFEQSWLYTGRKRGLGGAGSRGGVGVDVAEVVADSDAVLITQWVDDHTHMPTLQALPRSTPILAQPEAAERIAPLGFSSLTTIRPGESLPLCGGRLRVTATPGALVGPPWSARQNGYVLREQGVETPASLYYEPHCDFDAAGLSRALAGSGGGGGSSGVDVVVSPVQSVLLGGYPLLKGDTDLVQLLALLRPKVLVPLLNADLDQEGRLTALMSVRGSSAAAELRARLAASGLGGVRIEYPAPPGESLALAL